MSSEQTQPRNYESYWGDLKASHNAHPGNVYRYRLIRDAAVRLGLKPTSIVDCGCGDGSLLRMMHDAFPRAELCGMDISAAALEHAAGFGARVFQADLGKSVDGLPRFDLVLCSEVIEHIADDDSVLNNLTHLCGPGGWLILTTQSGRIYNTELYLGHLRHYRLSDLKRRLEARSFQVVSSFHAGWPWLRMQKIAAHHMQPTVKRHVVYAKQIPWWLRWVFHALAVLYRTASRAFGPQLVLVARLNEKLNGRGPDD